MKPDLSVVIVTWNSRADVLRCLASLGDPSLRLQVIVVDNGSGDGTVEAVAGEHPDVTIVSGHGNVGFPAANNLGLRHAAGRHVLFLNPDTEIGEGTLAACVAELDAHPDVGVVGCRLVYPDGRTQYECARNDYVLRDLLAETFWLHMLLPRSRLFGHNLMGWWDHLADRDVDAVLGAFMMARREAVDAVGGLPEEVFMYHEDLSFCLRVRRAGWRVRYLAGLVTVHHGGRSSGQSSTPLYLLEGEFKLRLIREAQGPVHAAVGRALFGIRSLLRLGVALAGQVPGAGRARERYPRVFDARRHALQFLWSVWPRAVREHLPQAARTPRAGGPGLDASAISTYL